MNPLITIGFTTILAERIVTVAMEETGASFILITEFQLVPGFEKLGTIRTIWDTEDEAAEENTRINIGWAAAKRRPGAFLPITGGAS